MTDAESFYLILTLFYLVECLKLLPPGTKAIANPIGRGKSWTPRSELVRFMGIGKWLFLAPLVPWPGIMIVTSNRKPNTNESALRVARRFSVLRKRTHVLRVLSFSIFTFFFLVLPYLYFLQRGTVAFLISISIGYFMMFTAAFLQFRIRRKILLNEKSGWITHTLYTALLPWHAMRCADQLFFDYTRHWSWPAVLAAHADSPSARKHLLRLWRNSRWGKKPRYSIEVLKSILEEAGVDANSSINFNHSCGTAKQCPCCLASYQPNYDHCPDCGDIELLNHHQ